MHAVPAAPETGAPQKEKKALLLQILNVLSLVLSVAAALAVALSFFIQLVRVDGSSMEHTLHSGEIMLVTRQGDYRRGEVVICRYPRRQDFSVNLGAALSLTRYTVFVKRLVALPGDSVEIRQGVLYVNDEIVPNPSTMGSVPRDYARRELKRDEYFVIGDNRLSSHDSRAFDVGPISRAMLQGHVRRVIWPLSRVRSVE